MSTERQRFLIDTLLPIEEGQRLATLSWFIRQTLGPERLGPYAVQLHRLFSGMIATELGVVTKSTQTPDDVQDLLEAGGFCVAIAALGWLESKGLENVEPLRKEIVSRLEAWGEFSGGWDV